jgi:4-amino-4-deoxy-L-arabinose transferase-like glycosyltransferase
MTSAAADDASRAHPAERRRFDPVMLALVVLTLAVRLVDVDEPFLDLQTWRQADTAAVARNYYEEDFDFFHPRVDWRGDTPGYVEMEFPLYNYLTACGYWLVGGAKEWVGHLLSALFSAATIPLLYALAWTFYGTAAARIACFVFAVDPLDVFYGRAIMPDATMLFFSVGAVLFFLRWTESQRASTYVAAVVFAALAFLVKIPTLYLGLPLLFLAWQRFGTSTFRQPALWGYAVLTLGPTLAWYWWGFTLFEQTHLTYGIWNRYGYAKWGNLDVLGQPSFYRLMLARLWGVALTPVGFVLLVAGALMSVRDRRERVLHVWLLAIVAFVLIAAEGNRIHKHYQLPFVPVAAVFAGKALGALWSHGFRLRALGAPAVRAAVVAACLVAMTAFSYVHATPLFAVQPFYQAQWEIGRDVDGLIPKDALLVTGEIDDNKGTPYRSQSPILLYFAHRKGWQLVPEEFTDPNRLRDLAARGARYFLVPEHLLFLEGRGIVKMVLTDANLNAIADWDKEHMPPR